MTKNYLVLHLAGVEVLAARLFQQEEAARACFDSISEKESIGPEYESSDLTLEAPGTLRLAGDDAESVQLLEVEVTIK